MFLINSLILCGPLKTICKLLWGFGTDKRISIYEKLKHVCIGVHEALLIIVIIIRYGEKGRGDRKLKNRNECNCRKDFTKINYLSPIIVFPKCLLTGQIITCKCRHFSGCQFTPLAVISKSWNTSLFTG